MSGYVLDASALISFLMGGPGSIEVRDLIDLAIQGKVQLLMSMVNWGEVYHSAWRYRGYDAAIRVSNEIARLPIELEDANYEATRMAAEMKVRYRLPYADCFAASLARRKGAIVVTSDRDFKSVGDVVDVRYI
ncbi:MAG: type II toxin-antitoxin system VapC family toxin [Candidatus Acidiferrales bacterium]